MEGPEAGVYYRGQSEIKGNNSVEIILPPYTKKFSNFSIQLTPIGKYNKLSCREVCNNVFHVFGQNGKFYWTVFATRQEINTTVDKSSVNVSSKGPYTFLQ